MDLRSRLAAAICLLKEPEQDVELLMSAFACCQKLLLRAKDADGVCWSKELLQGILLKYKRFELQKQDLFHILVRCFGKEEQLETVESSVALAACHVARCSDSEESEAWYLRSFREAKTDYLRFEAAIGLGKLSLKQQEGKVTALAWFMMAVGSAEKAMLPDSAIIARYQAAKTLVMLGCFEDYLQEDGSKFAIALVHMLKATTECHQPDFSVQQTVNAYTKGRAMLVPLMANLQVKLAEYLGFSSKELPEFLSPCKELLEFLSLDQFSKRFIYNCSRFTHDEAEAALQVERFFFIYEIYRDSRKDLISIQEVVPFETYVDPRPYLEEGIEFLYIEDPSAALEPLVMCQQAALQAGQSSGVFWASGHIVIYCEKQAELGQKELLSRLTRCFISRGRDGEHPEAWAAYYVGRAGNKDGKVDQEMLKTALTNSKTLALKYYASEALGDSSEDRDLEVRYYELMVNYAKRLGKEDLIIYASLVLFGHLHNFLILKVQSYERADQVRKALERLISGFREPTLGQAAVSYMEAFQYFDGNGATAAFKKAINMLERLPVCSIMHLYHPYLARGDREDEWSVVKDHCAQNIQENALWKLSIHDDVEGRPTEQVLLHSLGEELHKSELLNRHFMNLIYKIDSLYKQQRLEEAEAEAASMLQELEEQDGSGYSHCSMFAGLAFSYLGAITLSYQQREGYTLECSNDVFDMFMEEATSRGEALPTILFYHGELLRQQERGHAAAIEKHCKALLPMCLKVEDKLGSFSVGRIYNLEGLKHNFRFLQYVLWENGEMGRALIWAERERTRDLLYTLKYGGEDRDSYLQTLAEFDEDDEKAWAEIQDVCNIMGEETVILVITQTMKHLLLYMLHSGTKLTGHKHYIETPLGFRAEHLNSRSFDEEAFLLDLELHHELLIKPFSEQLEQIQPKRIIFVPNQDLCSVPFSGLLDSSRSNKPYLIQRYSTTTISSLRLLKQCELRRQQLQKHYSQKPTLTTLVVGNPTLDLVEALEESQFVASTLKQAGFSTVNCPAPENATKEAVLRMLPESDWIHFATHGRVNAEFPDGALLLSNGQTRTTQALRRAPEDKMEHELDVVVEQAFRSAGASGILTSEEIVENISGPLKAAAIVLSACSSGVGRVFSEGVLALSRAFHLCQTPSTVVSLWNLGDESTKLLMEKLYTNLANGMEIAEALKEAMVEMIDEKDVWGDAAYYNSPKYWAPFIISGSPFTGLPPSAKAGKQAIANEL